MLFFTMGLLLLDAASGSSSGGGLRSLSLVLSSKMPQLRQLEHPTTVAATVERTLKPFGSRHPPQISRRRILEAAAEEEDGHCLPCIPGSFSLSDANGGYACMPCPPGTFSNRSASASCLECPPGYEDAFNSTGCAKCMPGFSSSGGNACTPCKEGYFSAVQGSSQCLACSRYICCCLVSFFSMILL